MKSDLELMNDKDFDVRYQVAWRIDPNHLPNMMNDKDYYIRYEVAKRIDPKYLPMMMNDENYYIRLEVAKRIDPKFLDEMFGLDFHPEYQADLIRILSQREDLKKWKEIIWNLILN